MNLGCCHGDLKVLLDGDALEAEVSDMEERKRASAWVVQAFIQKEVEQAQRHGCWRLAEHLEATVPTIENTPLLCPLC